MRVLSLTPTPGRRHPADVLRSHEPTLFHVVCPDGLELAEGARFRARADRGDVCLPWSDPGGEPCLAGVEPAAEQP